MINNLVCVKYVGIRILEGFSLKLEKIVIKNYRLLRNIDVSLENELSLIIGKNNTGKTSFLNILKLFIGGKNAASMSYDDFSCMLKDQLYDYVCGSNTQDFLKGSCYN
ncbi:hypothetical protein DKL61_10345 [Gammaproteobacteria bacterium ESL0073]|nr:hypothetical protein DKL61_10345 [Gammaproteobacteria bacterium ESL0073]